MTCRILIKNNIVQYFVGPATIIAILGKSSNNCILQYLALLAFFVKKNHKLIGLLVEFLNVSSRNVYVVYEKVMPKMDE